MAHVNYMKLHYIIYASIQHVAMLMHTGHLSHVCWQTVSQQNVRKQTVIWQLQKPSTGCSLGRITTFNQASTCVQAKGSCRHSLLRFCYLWTCDRSHNKRPTNHLVVGFEQGIPTMHLSILDRLHCQCSDCCNHCTDILQSAKRPCTSPQQTTWSSSSSHPIS